MQLDGIFPFTDTFLTIYICQRQDAVCPPTAGAELFEKAPVRLLQPPDVTGEFPYYQFIKWCHHQGRDLRHTNQLPAPVRQPVEDHQTQLGHGNLTMDKPRQSILTDDNAYAL